jgi:hypothetical protein
MLVNKFIEYLDNLGLDFEIDTITNYMIKYDIINLSIQIYLNPKLIFIYDIAKKIDIFEIHMVFENDYNNSVKFTNKVLKQEIRKQKLKNL